VPKQITSVCSRRPTVLTDVLWSYPVPPFKCGYFPAARLQFQVRSCGIRGGQSGIGASFLRVLRFPLPILNPTTGPHSLVILPSTLYRMSKEEGSIFWEVIVSVVLSRNVCICTCILFRTVSGIELFHCTAPKLLIRKRYYVLFLIPVFIVQVTKLV
jgi:hypothetical protein